MFCFQCEQTAKGEGCTRMGVCGKPPEVAALQDLLIHVLKGLALYAVKGRKWGSRIMRRIPFSTPEADLHAILG